MAVRIDVDAGNAIAGGYPDIMMPVFVDGLHEVVAQAVFAVEDARCLFAICKKFQSIGCSRPSPAT